MLFDLLICARYSSALIHYNYCRYIVHYGFTTDNVSFHMEKCIQLIAMQERSKCALHTVQSIIITSSTLNIISAWYIYLNLMKFHWTNKYNTYSTFFDNDYSLTVKVPGIINETLLFLNIISFTSIIELIHCNSLALIESKASDINVILVIELPIVFSFSLTLLDARRRSYY